MNEKSILATVTKEIGKIALPEKIQFVSGLPKTRSGKIMRRILRKVAEGDTKSLGDTSTLLDPAVVDEIVKNAKIKLGDLFKLPSRASVSTLYCTTTFL
jgi:acetyl-CoA synthetase